MMYWNNHDDLGIPPWLSHPQPSHQEANSEAQAQGHHSKGKDGLQALQWRIGMSQVTSRYGYEAPKISKLVYKSNNYGLWYL